MFAGIAALMLLGVGLLGAACLVWPAVVVAGEVVTAADWSRAALGPRQWSLFVQGTAIALAAAAGAQVIGAGLAAGLVQRGRLSAVFGWVCLTVLLTPPYVYAYAWSLRVLPEGIAVAPLLERGWMSELITRGRAIWCLACWTAPVAAAVLACGWRSSGRPALELALIDANPPRALLRLAPAVFGPWLALSLTATGMLALTEYSVCHLCLVNVWNTEILAQTQLANRSGQALLLGWPMLLIAAAVAGVWWRFRDRIARLLDELALLRSSVDPAARRAATRMGSIGVASLAAVIVMLPIAFMLMSLHDSSALLRTWRVYPRAWPDGLLVAAGCMLVSTWIAIGIDYVLAAPRGSLPRGLRSSARAAATLLLALAGVFAIAPPALVGDAFLAAYLDWPWISDTVVVLWLTTAARFVLISVIVLRVAGRIHAGDLTQVAAAERVGWSAAYWRIRLPLAFPALAFSALVVGLLALTEVSATFLVTPPNVRNLARTVLNEIHYGRQDEVIAMSLYLAAFVGTVVALAGWRGAGRGVRSEVERQ